MRFRLPASLRIAWLIIRACRPTVWSPICPSSSAARRQRRDGVDRDDVDGAGAHEHVGDLERLLAVVGLRDEQLVDVDADPLGVERVHRVLGVDERADAAELLGLGEHVVDQRRLARGLRAEDLDDAPARDAADAEREVERQRARRDRRRRWTWAPGSPMRMTVPLPNWRSICVSAPCRAASRALAAFSSAVTAISGVPLVAWSGTVSWASVRTERNVARETCHWQHLFVCDFAPSLRVVARRERGHALADEQPPHEVQRDRGRAVAHVGAGAGHRDRPR